MKTSKGIAFFTAVVVWILMVSSAMAGDSGKDVNIVNTKSNPVPITGNIGITGTANVNLTNTEKNPLPITIIKERIPFSISSYCNVSSQNYACEVRDDLKITPGMRAVILFAQCHVEAIHQAPESSGLCTIQQDDTSSLPIPPSTGFRAVPTLFLSPVPGHFGVASLSTNMVFTGKSLATGRIYVKPEGTPIQLSSIWFTLSGYFEPN